MNILKFLFWRKRKPVQIKEAHEIFLTEKQVGRRGMFLIEMGKANGWMPIAYQSDIGMLSFAKEDMRINIYITKMTVATILTHPTKGRRQMFRKKVGKQMMENIFINPRIHTGVGYTHK